MASIGKFVARVHKTSDKKKLKDSSKIYSYGSISIRDPKLNNYIGKKVVIRIFTDQENNKVKK